MITIGGSPNRVACAGNWRAISVPNWASDHVASEGTGRISDAEWTGTADVSGLTGAAPEAIYRQGWIAASGSIQYTVNGLGLDADYLVRVHFAAPFGTSAATYVFDVTVAGDDSQQELDVDPVVRRGAGKGDLVEFEVTTGESQSITVTITPNASKTAVICGLEVIPASPEVIPATELPTDANPTVLGTGQTSSAPSILLQLSDGSRVAVPRVANSLIATDESGVSLEAVTLVSLGLNLGIFE